MAIIPTNWGPFKFQSSARQTREEDWGLGGCKVEMDRDITRADELITEFMNCKSSGGVNIYPKVL